MSASNPDPPARGRRAPLVPRRVLSWDGRVRDHPAGPGQTPMVSFDHGQHSGGRFLALGTRPWLSEAAAAGTAKIRVTMAEATELA